MESEYESLLRQVEKLNNLPSEHASEVLDLDKRRELRKKLRTLSVALEDHGEIVDRIIYSPSDIVTVRIAVELGLFKILVDSEKPKTVQELAKMTAGDEKLLGRLLRHLAGIDAVAHAGPDSYGATKVSRAFTTAKGISGTGLFVNVCVPAWMKLPKTLSEAAYGNPSDSLHCAFHAALNTSDRVFDWYAKNPSVLDDFNVFMTAQREGHANWLDFYPCEQQIRDASQSQDNNAVLFVDVGGAYGHEIQEIRRRYPTLGGRMVLQDLAQTIEQVSAGPALEPMVHDMFTPQPIKGAHAYYFRNIFHDWPDEHCRTILQQTCTAMAKGFSKILINEMVVPLQGGDLFALQSDINMMSMFAGMERTEQQWHELLNSVGLEIVKIWTKESDSESIIEAMLC